MSDQDQEIETVIDPSDLKKYRIELPNLYDDADLDPFEFRLLAHYKRVGVCTQSTATTAKMCHMSAGQVSEKRKTLAEKGWILLTSKGLKNGSFSYEITVVDKWEENFKKYKALSRSERHPSHSEGTPSPHENTPSHSETKNKPLKKEPIKNSDPSSKEKPALKGIEAAIAMGRPVQPDDLPEIARKTVTNAFESALKFNPLPWGTKAPWNRLERFLIEKHAENPHAFEEYQHWRSNGGKFEAMSNKQIYADPDKLIACWPAAFASQPENDGYRVLG
jgi:hypothetical protein